MPIAGLMEKRMDEDNIVSLPTKSEKQRGSKQEKGSGYSSLSITEKWAWHTETYAWRIVHGYGSFDDIAVGKYSPTDPKGEWWDEGAVRLKVRMMTADRDRRSYAEEEAKRELAAKGRAICDAWAIKHGYIDFEAALRAGKGWTDVKRSIAGPKMMPKARSTRYTAGDLGVKAEPTPIVIPDGQAEFLRSELAKRLGKATGEAAE